MKPIVNRHPGKPKSAQAAGQFDQLIGALQKRFGYNRARAERELRRRLAKHHATVAARQGTI